jgi:hypothetical protein
MTRVAWQIAIAAIPVGHPSYGGGPADTALCCVRSLLHGDCASAAGADYAPEASPPQEG